MDKKRLLSEILKRADELVRGDIGVSSLEHQMHTRLYNNSFCNLLKEGVHAREDKERDKITIVINKQQYDCPVKTVENILRAEYEVSMKRCLSVMDGQAETYTDTDKNNAAPGIRNISEFDISADDFMFTDADPVTADVSLKNSFFSETRRSEEYRTAPVSGPDRYPHTDFYSHGQYAPGGSPDNADTDSVSGEKSGRILEFRPRETVVDSLFSSDAKYTDEADAGGEEDDSLNAFIPGMRHRHNETEAEERFIKEDSSAVRSFLPKSEAGKSVSIEEDDARHGFFPGDRRSQKKSEAVFKEPEKEAPKQRLGFRLGRRRRELTEEDTAVRFEHINAGTGSASAFKPRIPEEIPERKEFSDTPYEIPGSRIYEEKPAEDHSQDGGELFMHRHCVTLIKSYGNDRVGPFRFTFWPINVPKGRDRQFADMLVHVVDDTAKTEQLFICDAVNPELSLTFDKKSIKVFGIWEAGKFDSHITLQGQTASMFKIKDETDKKEPENISDSFFDQFRFERKGQPKHFAVPFTESNHGEENIPIVGYVEIKNQRYPLKRMEANTIRYRYENRQRVVTGHWEDDKFCLKVDSSLNGFG